MANRRLFENYEDLPEKFDHVIKFLPEIPDGPHSEEQHEEIGLWNNKLQEFNEKEKTMPAVTRIGDADVAHCSGMTRAAGS